LEYRIIIETARSGDKKYYIQKRVMWYFWVYLTEVRDITMYNYRIFFYELKDAENHIQKMVDYEYERYQSKIIKREVYLK
jgi:hypothetical protein